MTPGILSLPVLADGFRRFVQPITVSQQRDEFDGAEKLHRVPVGPAQWRNFPALARTPTSSGVQFRSFATCAASSRAGKSFAAHVASPVELCRQSFSFGNRNSTMSLRIGFHCKTICH